MLRHEPFLSMKTTTIKCTHPYTGKIVYSYDIMTGVATGETAEITTASIENVALKFFDKAGKLKSADTDSRITVYEY